MSIQVSGSIPAFPARWLYGLYVLSLVSTLCHHHQRDAKHHRRLDASTGASGPHDFVVRLRAVRYRHACVHRIPTRVRGDRDPPLSG